MTDERANLIAGCGPGGCWGSDPRCSGAIRGGRHLGFLGADIRKIDVKGKNRRGFGALRCVAVEMS